MYAPAASARVLDGAAAGVIVVAWVKDRTDYKSQLDKPLAYAENSALLKFQQTTRDRVKRFTRDQCRTCCL